MIGESVTVVEVSVSDGESVTVMEVSVSDRGVRDGGGGQCE